MKPMGPIPSGFGCEDGMLLIGGCGAESLVDEAGDTPLFVYDMALVEAKVRRFRDAMPAGIDLHYAIKANPFAPLLSRMAVQVDGFDIASGGELEMALEAGILKGTNVIARPLDAPAAARDIALIWRKNSPRENDFRLLADELRAG